MKLKPLWICPKCGEKFVTSNIWHSCGSFSLKDLFAKSEPNVIRLFFHLKKMIEKCGPVKMIPQKTRVVFMVRVRFAGVIPRKYYLLCNFALAGRIENKRFLKVTSYSKYFHGYQIKIENKKDLNIQLQKWLYQSYKVGTQETLAKIK
jgi:hypothetical protein